MTEQLINVTRQLQWNRTDRQVRLDIDDSFLRDSLPARRVHRRESNAQSLYTLVNRAGVR